MRLEDKLGPLATIVSFSAETGRGLLRIDGGTEKPFSKNSFVLGLRPLVGDRVIVYDYNSSRATQVGPATKEALERRAVVGEKYRVQLEAQWRAQVREAIEARKKQITLANKHADPESLRAEWTRRLKAAGLRSGPVERALESARLGARLVALPAEEAPRCGLSKFGGLPDLAPGTTWPTFHERPLTFVVQIDLADVPEDVRSSLCIPPAGLLSFFFDDAEQPWGYSPAHRGAAAVLFAPEVGKLRESKPRSPHRSKRRCRSCQSSHSLGA